MVLLRRKQPSYNLLQDNLHNPAPSVTDGALGRNDYSELYARENMVSEEDLKAIECLLVLEELDCEALELKEALGSLAPGKAPRKDIIPSEILKC